MCLVGVVVRRYIDFLILLIPTPLLSALFCSSIYLSMHQSGPREAMCNAQVTSSLKFNTINDVNMQM